MLLCDVRGLFVALSLAGTAKALSSQGHGYRCGVSLSEHNATLALDVVSTNQSINEIIGKPTWAISVDEHAGEVETDIWFSPDDRDYATTSEFQACAILLWNFPEFTLIRGAEDSGKCGTALSPRCLNALNDTIASSASKWAPSSTPGTTKTLSTDQICHNIKNDLFYNSTTSWPEECWDDFGYTPAVSDVDGSPYAQSSGPYLGNNNNDLTIEANGIWWTNLPMTGDFNASLDKCKTSIGSHSLNLVLTNDLSSSYTKTNDPYSSHVNSMYMAITVFLGNDLHQDRSFKPWTSTQMNCLVPRNFSAGSRVVKPLSSADYNVNNTSSSTDHSDGGIGLTPANLYELLAAIVPTIVIMGLFISWRCGPRRRRRISDNESTQSSDRSDQSPSVVEGSVSDVHEMCSCKKKELAAKEMVELRNTPARVEAGSGTVFELNPGDGWLVELPGAEFPRHFTQQM